MNKKEITLVIKTINTFFEKNSYICLFFKGGEQTKDEMCLHMFLYYPRMNNLSSCITLNSGSVWQSMMNTSSYV